MAESASKPGDPERVEQRPPEEWIATNGDAGPMRTSTPWCREPRGFRRPTAKALSAPCVGQMDIETAIKEATVAAASDGTQAGVEAELPEGVVSMTDWAVLARKGRKTGVTVERRELPPQVADIRQFGATSAGKTSAEVLTEIGLWRDTPAPIEKPISDCGTITSFPVLPGKES